MAGDRLALGRLHPLLEVVVEGLAALEMTCIHVAHGVDRELPFLLAQLGIRGTPADRARRFQRVFEADAVELLHLAQVLLARAVGGGKLGIGLEDLLASRA